MWVSKTEHVNEPWYLKRVKLVIKEARRCTLAYSLNAGYSPSNDIIREGGSFVAEKELCVHKRNGESLS